MKWEYLGTGLALIGIGVTLMVALPPPWWLKMPAGLVHAGLLGGIILTLTGLCLLVVGIWPDLPEAKIGPIFVTALGALVFVSGVVWYNVGNSTQTTSELASDAPDPNILIECHLGVLPTTTPAEGRIYALGLWPLPAENGGGGLEEHFPLGAQGEWKWPTSNGFPLQAYQCQITNYGNAPVFNVELTLHLTFIQALKDDKNPSTIRSGAVTLSREWPIQITKIDAGKNDPFVFYIYNISQEFAGVSLPQAVSLERTGETLRRTVRLIRPTGDHGLMPLSPMIEMKT